MYIEKGSCSWLKSLSSLNSQNKESKCEKMKNLSISIKLALYQFTDKTNHLYIYRMKNTIRIINKKQSTRRSASKIYTNRKKLVKYQSDKFFW